MKLFHKIVIGVPQGSMLGLQHVNDLSIKCNFFQTLAIYTVEDLSFPSELFWNFISHKYLELLIQLYLVLR